MRRPPLTILDDEVLVLACPFVPDPGELTVSGNIVDVIKERGIRHEAISVSMGSGLEDFIPDHTTSTAKGGGFLWEGVPVTFAGEHRQLCLAEDSKYDIVAVQPVDMFPHTMHVENVAKLILKG